MFWSGLTAMLLQNKFVNVMLGCYLLSVFVILSVLLLYRLRQNTKCLSGRGFCSLLEVLLKDKFTQKLRFIYFLLTQ